MTEFCEHLYDSLVSLAQTCQICHVAAVISGNILLPTLKQQTHENTNLLNENAKPHNVSGGHRQLSPDLITCAGYANMQAEKFPSVTPHGQLYKINLYKVFLNYSCPELNFKHTIYIVLPACNPKKGGGGIKKEKKKLCYLLWVMASCIPFF